jgi:nucleoid DNA-binding protein
MIDLSIISKLLRRLLSEHTRVSVPGLGAFMVDDLPATIIRGGKSLVPPSKQISFSSSETWNDGLLEYAFANEQNCTTEEAEKQIALFSQQLAEKLNAGRRIEFPEFGILRITDDKEWRFVPHAPLNDIDTDTFGLIEIDVTPLTPGDSSTAPQQDVQVPSSFPRPASISEKSSQDVQVPSSFPRPASISEESLQDEQRPGLVWWIMLMLVCLTAAGYIFRQSLLDFIENVSYTPEELEYLHKMEREKNP